MATHCADDGEPVSWMADVQVRDQDIKLALSYQPESFSYGSSGSHFEAVGFQERRKSQSDTVFVINE